MGLDDDEIWNLVVGPSASPFAVPRAVSFPQFCRDVRSVAASALSQDETR